MEENTTIQTAEGGDTTAQEGAKNFTQEEVNAIVSRRLSEDRAKQAATLAQKERELQQKEYMLTARETLTSRGLPLELLEALNASDQDALTRSLDIVEKSFKGRRKAHAPEVLEAIGKQLIAEGVNPKAVNLMTLAIDSDDVQYDGKGITNWADIGGKVKEKYPEFYGTIEKMGADVGSPPTRYSYNSNPGAATREAFGLPKG